MSDTVQHTLHDRPQRGAPPGQRRRGGRGKLLVGVAGIIVVGLVAYGVITRSNHVAALRKIADQESVAPVQVIHPAHAPSSRTLDLPGSVHAWYAAPIYGQVSGYVQHWYKDYGAPVKAGDLLATIDAPELDAQFETAKSNLAVAQARYNLALVTAKRWQALAGTQAVSQQQVDVQTASAIAEKAQVEAAQHDVARYQALEQFKNVVAPFDGVVTSRNTDVGAYVNANGGAAGAAGTSTELFSVADVHKMRVFVSVPQDYASMLRPGLKANIGLSQFPGKTFDARFETSANSFNPLSRTVVTELIVANPDHAIWPGAYATVHFTIPANPNILMVPEESLLFRAHGMQVAVVNPDHTVSLRDVKLGLNLGLNVQILEGLSPGEQIVDDPSAGLLDGQHVNVVLGAPGIAPDTEFRPPPIKSKLSSEQKAKVEAAQAGVSE